MTATINPQTLQTDLDRGTGIPPVMHLLKGLKTHAKDGLDVGDDDGPDSSVFAPISDRARNAMSTLLEKSARRLVMRAKMPAPSDKRLVRDVKAFIDSVLKLERTNRSGGTSAEKCFVRITKPTRKSLSELLDHVSAAVADRDQDPTDDFVRDSKIILDCMVKVERFNLSDARGKRAGRGRSEAWSVTAGRRPESKQPAAVSHGQAVPKTTQVVAAGDKRSTEQQRAAQPTTKATVKEMEKQIKVEQRSTAVPPVCERALQSPDAPATQNPIQERMPEHPCPPRGVPLSKRNRHGQNTPGKKSRKGI